MQYYHGHAQFVGPKRISVSGHLLEADQILIAIEGEPTGLNLGWTVSLRRVLHVQKLCSSLDFDVH